MIPATPAPSSPPGVLLAEALAPGPDGAAALLDRLARLAEAAGATLDAAAARLVLEATAPTQRSIGKGAPGQLLLTLMPLGEARHILASWLPPSAAEASLDMGLFRTVMDQLPAAVSIKDAERRYRFVNRLWEVYVGLPREAALGRRFEELDFAHMPAHALAQARDLAQERDQTALREDAPAPFEQPFTGQDGTARTLLISKVPLRGMGDGPPGILSITLDINESKRAEAELRTIAAELTQRSAALSAAHDRAEKARREAEAAAQAKGRFLAMMSHELRTPMTGLLGVLDMMEATPPADPRLHDVRASAETLMRVLDDILDYSLIESGSFQLRDAAFNPTAVLREVAGQFSRAATARGLALRVDAAPGVTDAAMGDAPRLRQLVGQLLGNAVKFTAAGHVALHLEQATGPNGEEELRFSVADTGPGIPADRRAELFQPYTPLEAVTSRSAGGTGLGLVMCRQLATAMGGRIWCQEAPSGGADFRFNLPLRRPAEAAPPRPDLETPARILVVDDVALNRKVVSAILERDGHEVILAASGEEGVAHAAEGGFDLVLMDLHMPGMDGMAATRAIRALEGPSGRVPIHALTADVFARGGAEFAEAGFDGFLTKPLDWAAIRRTVNEARGANAADGVPVLDSGHLAGMFKDLPRDAVEDMFNEFLDSLHDVVGRLREEHAVGNIEALRREAHTLKGLAANFGAARIAAAAASLQARLEEGALPSAAELMPVDVALARTAGALRAGTHLSMLDAQS